MSFLFWTGVGVTYRVYMCVHVCIRSRTFKPDVGYLDVSPGVWMRHLESPKNPGRLNLRIHISILVYVYKVVHTYIYMFRQIAFFFFFFFPCYTHAHH